MLLRCNLSADTIIITKALAAVEDSPYEDDFGHDHAIRAVVEAAIAHNRHSASSSIKVEASGSVKRAFPGSSQIGMLPWPERAVYFLRDVLHYSSHDTVLLLGMSDTHIDQLYRFAAKLHRLLENLAFRGDKSQLADAKAKLFDAEMQKAIAQAELARTEGRF